jgi:8-oxo-dGTP diphosphatase
MRGMRERGYAVRRERRHAPSAEFRGVVVKAHQRLAAYALIADGAGRVLLARPPEGRRGLGRWQLPGGGVEHGEHPEQTVIRELREETGLGVLVGPLRDVVSDVTVVGRRRRRRHNVRLIYLATAVAEPNSPGDRLSPRARWCTPQERLSLPLDPFVARLLGSGPDQRPASERGSVRP